MILLLQTLSCKESKEFSNFNLMLIVMINVYGIIYQVNKEKKKKEKIYIN